MKNYEMIHETNVYQVLKSTSSNSINIVFKKNGYTEKPTAIKDLQNISEFRPKYQKKIIESVFRRFGA